MYEGVTSLIYHELELPSYSFHQISLNIEIMGDHLTGDGDGRDYVIGVDPLDDHDGQGEGWNHYS